MAGGGRNGLNAGNLLSDGGCNLTRHPYNKRDAHRHSGEESGSIKGPHLGNNGLERVIGDGRRIVASRRYNEYGHVLE
jgi:hypothetical protein